VVIDSLYRPVASASAGIWRVTGTGWSLVLKLLRPGPGGHENWQAGDDEAQARHLGHAVDRLLALFAAAQASRARFT
jgi:hypothetical protein